MEKQLKAIKTKLQQNQELTPDDTAYIVSIANNVQICNYMDGVAWEQSIDVTEDDDTGYEYINVRWLPTEEYNKAQQAYEDACHTYDDDGNLDDDLIDRLAAEVPEEDSACDWDAPYSITLN